MAAQIASTRTVSCQPKLCTPTPCRCGALLRRQLDTRQRPFARETLCQGEYRLIAWLVRELRRWRLYWLAVPTTPLYDQCTAMYNIIVVELPHRKESSTVTMLLYDQRCSGSQQGA